jgi:8-oxo-dGTP diphosphatase
MTELKQFNIRVYAIILNDLSAVLVSDEFQIGMRMTKFPGGGLDLGEGTIECLKREAMEEFGQEIEIIDHFYTTDFFQKALFFDDQQLIAIYYTAKFIESPKFKISTKAFDFESNSNGSISFRWIPLNDISENDFTFPIDKVVAKKFANSLIC